MKAEPRAELFVPQARDYYTRDTRADPAEPLAPARKTVPVRDMDVIEFVEVLLE